MPVKYQSPVWPGMQRMSFSQVWKTMANSAARPSGLSSRPISAQSVSSGELRVERLDAVAHLGRRAGRDRRAALGGAVLEQRRVAGLAKERDCVNPGVGTRIEELTRFYFDFHWKQEKVIGCVINDPLAASSP